MPRFSSSPPLTCGLLLVFACGSAACTPGSSPETGNSGADTGNTDETDTGGSGEDPDTAETGDPIPEGWPDPWGVLALNLHCLKLDDTDYEDNESRMADIAREVLARDLVGLALQEACVDEEQDAMALLESALEEQSGVSWEGAWTYAHMAWEDTEDEAEEGVGVLARGTLSDLEETTFHAQGALQRVMVGATLENGVRLFSVHLDHADDDARGDQGREVASVALASSDPVVDIVVAGDFNDDAHSSACWAMDATGFVEDTSEQGDDRDHIYHHRGAALEPVEASYLFDGEEGPVVSDHLGLAAWYTAGQGEDYCFTRVEAQVEVSAAEAVYVRGDYAPLDWNYGLPAHDGGDGTWTWVTTEIHDDPFEYKFLLDDTTWQTGDNLEGQGCEDQSAAPEWEVGARGR